MEIKHVHDSNFKTLINKYIEGSCIVPWSTPFLLSPDGRIFINLFYLSVFLYAYTYCPPFLTQKLAITILFLSPFHWIICFSNLIMSGKGMHPISLIMAQYPVMCMWHCFLTNSYFLLWRMLKMLLQIQASAPTNSNSGNSVWKGKYFCHFGSYCGITLLDIKIKIQVWRRLWSEHFKNHLF